MKKLLGDLGAYFSIFSAQSLFQIPGVPLEVRQSLSEIGSLLVAPKTFTCGAFCFHSLFRSLISEHQSSPIRRVPPFSANAFQSGFPDN